MARQLTDNVRPRDDVEPQPATSEARRRGWRTRLRRTRAHLVIIGSVVAISLAGVAVASFALTETQGRPVDARVNGRPVGFFGHRPTVADALRAAHVVPRDGILYGLVSHRRLDRRAVPARFYVDGRDARPKSPIRSGQHVTVVDGRDAIEPSDRREVPAPPPGLPPVENQLWNPGKPGVQEAEVGTVSGEAAGLRLVSQPSPAEARTDKVVGLSFDDGPDPRWSPTVLQILKDEGVKATFCIVGYLGARRPDIVKAEFDQGHTMCDHTMHHMIHLDTKPHPQIVDEVDQGADVLRSIIGQEPAIYRPPGGSLSPDVIDVAHQRGLRVLKWSVDPADYRTPPADVIKSRILSKIGPGAVILMHDGGGDRSHTVAMLKGLIDELKAQGYSFATPLG